MSDEKVNILLVDDRLENLVALEAILAELGQNLVRASSGMEALRHLLDDEFAVILLDVQMPEMDGFETATLIRSRDKSRHTPIIFLTAIDKSASQVARGYSVGAIDYVFKPFVPEILRAKVAAFVELAKKTRALQAEILLRQEAEEAVRRLNEELERRVAARTAALKAANEELHSEIVERKRAEQELLMAKEAAERANRSKSQFLATMSHELRTPLNAVIGFSEVLVDQTFGPLNDRQQRYVNNILTSGRHLLQLINDILDLAKVEAGRLELDLAAFDVAEALRVVETIAKPLAAKKRIALQTEVEPELPAITADEAKFKQVMYNLLSNAVKFTPEGGSVHVTACREETDEPAPEEVGVRRAVPLLRVSVADTGIGIREEDRERVFGEFVQLDASYARQQQGTGLGLALTRKLIEMHGGRIWVESAGVEGQGSTFTFLLPFQVAQRGTGGRRQEAGGRRQEAGGREHSSELPTASCLLPTGADLPPASCLLPTGTTPASPAASQEARPEGARPAVLVVEDDPSASELLAHALSEAGYDVVPAFDGEQAIEMARSLQPSAITLDVVLPQKGGWEVLAALKSLPETKAIPVVIVSITEDRQMGLALGAADYLVKPVDRERLVEAVTRAGAAAGRKTPRVLVVDDQPETVELMTEVLQASGFSVVQARGGEEAVRLAVEELPDVMVLDLLMPEVSGFEVVRRLREHPQAREIPILVFTAGDLSEEERAELASHVRAVVSKSALDELLRELRRARRLKA